ELQIEIGDDQGPIVGILIAAEDPFAGRGGLDRHEVVAFLGLPAAVIARGLGAEHHPIGAGQRQRVDIVGMGCNAALNGINAAASWVQANNGRPALVICCEINSAIHVRDDRPVTSVVNSLFGDGCGAALITGPEEGKGPRLLGFTSQIVPAAWRAISYHWSAHHGKFELYLDKSIPDVLGEHSPTPISALLAGFGLCRSAITHWLVHAGGKKVISAIKEANQLTDHDVRHSSSVLRRCGNLGSATIMFSYKELMREGVSPGDYGVVVTMGPGAQIETALLQW
ncbi:MAG: hypothetical protein K2Y26_17205, partial [Gemmatimonadaceae bacterium]|nr:hypothetical protein [Gemmatimonadaceae bacterium]